MNKAILVVTLLLFSSFSYAQAGSWTPHQKISTIIIENGIALVLLEGGVSEAYIPSACNQQYNQVMLSSEHGKAVYSLALSAYLADKSVSIALGCSGNRPVINLIKF